MKDNFQYKGQWFLPAAKDKRVTGILTYDTDQGSSLELFGSFDDEFAFLPKMRNEDIIQGITNDSKQITLYKCFVTKSGGAKLIVGEESGQPTTVFTVNFIFEGVHADTPQELKFQKLVSEIHNLDEWVGISGFNPSSGDTIESWKTFELDVHYKLPEPIKFAINDQLEGQFNFVVNHPGWSRYQKEVALKQRVEIILTTQSELSAEAFLKYLFSFQNFLILALYNRTYPTSITFYSDQFTIDYGDGNLKRKKINLYFPISNRSKSDKLKLDFDMLFCYGHIKEEFQTIITNWFQKYDLLEPAFNLLFEQFYNNERFSENTFLNLAQAAETFHARTDNHTRMPKNEFNKMKEEILASVSEKYHEWLKDQFNFGNNLNLHSRLTEIVDKYSIGILDKIIGDKELFVKQVKWSRNYYTHYSSSGEKQALKGIDLFYLSEKLKILLVCSFLVEVGFERDKLKKKKKCFFYTYYRMGNTKKAAHNMGFAKMGADGSRVSTFVFQFGFISSRTLLI